MKLLTFAASLRRDSLNKKLITLASEIARQGGADVDVAEFRESSFPSMTVISTQARGCRQGAAN